MCYEVAYGGFVVASRFLEDIGFHGENGEDAAEHPQALHMTAVIGDEHPKMHKHCSQTSYESMIQGRSRSDSTGYTDIWTQMAEAAKIAAAAAETVLAGELS